MAKKVSIKYTGQADVRTISQEQFEGVDLKHPGVRFDRSTNFVQEVSQEAADLLLGTDSFELAE